MKPSGDEPADDAKAEAAVVTLTLEEQMLSLDQEVLESARRMTTDPEHRARIQKLLV